MEENKSKISNSSDVLQAYRLATDVAKESGDIDAEIAAYRKVIELGQRHDKVAPDDLLKYNMIMYWAYNNVADALFNKSFVKALDKTEVDDFSESLEYYQQGLKFARDNLEKVALLNRMADSYKYYGDEENLCKIMQKVFAKLKNKEKCMAYSNFAASLKNTLYAAQMYEEALNYIKDEETTLNEKCNHTSQICDKLLELYHQNHDQEGYGRIITLKANTENLQKTCIKKGGCSF